MNIIAISCLLTFVGGSTIPKPVHPNEDLIRTNRNTRIVGGGDAEIADFKWQASLRRSNSHTCGAAIIDDYAAVTAAHCVDPDRASDYSIMVGSSNRFHWKTYSVQTITVHPQYGTGSGNFPNDIAILKFDQKITSDANAEIVDLATTGDYSGTMCQITGWGRTCGSCGLPTTLQRANTTVMTNDECKSIWGNSRIVAGHVCVFNQQEGMGACNGDSGGPLTCGNKLVGVTSWGASGCSTNYPSVYTRISHYHDWIKNNM